MGPPRAALLPKADWADWADYGKDLYSAVSWENAPGGKRYMTGWMND